MKHRGVDFDVEEDPPSFWHWKIYPEAGPMVIGDMTVDACIIEINLGLDKGQRGGGSE